MLAATSTNHARTHIRSVSSGILNVSGAARLHIGRRQTPIDATDGRADMKATDTTQPTWTCDACNEPIRGVGFLHIEPWRVREDADNPDTWHVNHHACLPADVVDDEGYILGYTLEVSQVSTREGMAQWTRHLAEKNWYDLSQWRGMVLRSTGIDVARDAARARIWGVDGTQDSGLAPVAEATS